MGIVRWGPPSDLIVLLRDSFKINTFIETGTFKGGTSKWASKNFKQVETIEFSKKIYKETSSRLRDIPNINFRFGDSAIELVKILDGLKEQAIFWLDAHFCYEDSYGEKVAECPLLKELEIINNSAYNHIILIDDARGFLSPPAHPVSPKYYPNLKNIFAVIESKYDRSVFVFEDVIIAVPEKESQSVVNFLQDKTTQKAKLVERIKDVIMQMAFVFYSIPKKIFGR